MIFILYRVQRKGEGGNSEGVREREAQESQRDSEEVRKGGG